MARSAHAKTDGTLTSDILDRFEAAFRERGYEALSLSDLAAAGGLSRSALYRHYSAGKPAIGAAALHHVVYWMCYHVILPLRSPGEPRARLQQVADALEEFYDGGRRPCLIELFTLGEAGALYGPTTARMVEEMIDAFAAFYEETGRPAATARKRAEKNLTLLQGALVLCRVRASEMPFRQFIRKLMKSA